jgi:hypothetical protein
VEVKYELLIDRDMEWIEKGHTRKEKEMENCVE